MIMVKQLNIPFEYSVDELVELASKEVYPLAFKGKHPYDNKDCIFSYIGVMLDERGLKVPLYNCDTGHTLTLKTILNYARNVK